MPNEMILDVGVATGYYEIYQGDAFIDTTAAFEVRVMPCNELAAESAEDYKPFVNELVIATTRANDAASVATASAGAADEATASASQAAADASAAARDSRAAEAEHAEADRQREARQQKNDSDQAKSNAAEEQRAAAEEARAEADRQREVRQLKNNADQAQNNAAAKGMTYHICPEGEYALDAVDGLHNVPNGAGKNGVMYLTPKVDGATGEDAFDQWLYIDDAWELLGETGAHVEPVTTEDIERIYIDETVTADRYLNAAGLSYLWAKMRQTFATKLHKHQAKDIGGTLAIANGGTGASTAADALVALGAASASDVETLRESVSQDTADTGWYWAYKAADIDIRARRIGKTVYVNGKVRNVTYNTDWKSITTLPASYRPDIQTCFAGASTSGDHVVQMSIETDGIIYAHTTGGEVGGITFCASFPVK